MDRFEDLRAFVLVVESGNLTRAARAMQVATSAVSRRVRDLEARLGTQLLQRTTRHMRLTPAGEQFYNRAKDILAALEEAETEAGDSGRHLKGGLRIAVPVSFGHAHLTPILLDFARDHPDLSLDVDFSDRFVDLIREGHDLAIRIGQLDDSTLIARKLAEVRTVLAASPEFWDRHGRPERPEDLEGLPALRYSGGSERNAPLSCRVGGKETEVDVDWVMRASSGEFLCSAAEAGLGMTMGPSFIMRDAVESGRLEPVLTELGWPTVTIWALYPETRHLSARARTFIDFVAERIGPKPSWEDFLPPAD